MSPTLKHGILAALWALLCTLLQVGLHLPMGPLASVGSLLDPAGGLYYNARHAEHSPIHSVYISGLDSTVTVERDERGVPHIFASKERDAVMALGYVVAQDRLMQLDFLPRVASGRLAEVFGAAAVEADRFLRSTGMDWGAHKHVEWLAAEGGRTYALTQWFAEGANTYIDGLSSAELPFEFKLFDYRPDRYSPLHAARLLQYFAYDLTFRSEEPAFSVLRDQLGAEEFALLYPSETRNNIAITGMASKNPEVGKVVAHFRRGAREVAGWGAAGFRASTGSNNWVVGPERSSTGAPILAGDMHLALRLPAIWYEAHLATPGRNLYGVLPPGTPVLVEAFNDVIGWVFTNTGADVLDHYLLELDSSGRSYRYNGEWKALDIVLDTLLVKGGSVEIDTLWYSHFGPVLRTDSGAVAIRWVAHDPGRTLHALAGMNRATSMEEFDAALEDFAMPAQNIAAADTSGNISIRTTGQVPVRRGGNGVGLLDGTTDAAEWVGWVPFDLMPYVRNPVQGYLFSANQQPTDAAFPYYFGHDWPDPYRAMRIDQLLQERPFHTVSDFIHYQGDMYVVQRDLFVPFLADLNSLSVEAEGVRALLSAWDGRAVLESRAALVFSVFLEALRALAWDEEIFTGRPKPKDFTLLHMLREGSDWLDVVATPIKEDTRRLVALALERTASSVEDIGAVRRDNSGIVFEHLMGLDAIGELSRGPFPFPGFDETVSPGGGMPTTHSASWRVVVDFSKRPPVGYGIYPGGQSGRPLSRFYDMHIAPYLAFEPYRLHKPRGPGELVEVSSTVSFYPGAVSR